MKAVRWPASILAGVLFGVGSLRAESLAGRFSISVQAGTQVELAGDATGPAQGALLGQPTILESRTYGDLYRPGLRLAALASYGVAQHLELTLRGSFYAPRAAVLEVGSFDDGPLLFCIEQVDGTGTACEEKRLPEYGLELGLRYTIAPQGRLKSYMAVAAGVRHTPEQLVSLQAPESAAAVLHLPFDDGGTRPVFGADLGFVYDLTPQVFLGLEGGVRLQKPRETDKPALPELFAVRTGDARWTLPVVATLGLRF